MRSILSKHGDRIGGSRIGARPPVAIELSPQGVLAAASPGPGQPPVYAFYQLPEGALVPAVGEPNLHAAEVVADAIRAALDQVAPRTRALTLVVPDTVVRVFVLDFDSLPAKPAEVLPILRFRLRKTVPFDVEHAGLTYQVLVESKTECKVLAAVIPGPILQEYEAVVRQAGYEPGAVLPSSLAALAAIDSEEPVLVANLGAQALTTSITNGQDLLLYRTLDLPEDPVQRLLEVQRGIAVASAFYEDKLGARPGLLHYAGIGAGMGADMGMGGDSAAEDFARWIFSSNSPNDPELAVVDVAPRPETGGPGDRSSSLGWETGAATPLGNVVSLAGVAGALAGAN